MNLTKTQNGFDLNGTSYSFNSFADSSGKTVPYEVFGDLQAHIGTDKGVLLLDTSVTIDGKKLANIVDFITELEIQ